MFGKTDQYFGALPGSAAKRIVCDFTAMRASRPVPVQIVQRRHSRGAVRPGSFQDRPYEIAGAVAGAGRIRSGSMRLMHGGLGVRQKEIGVGRGHAIRRITSPFRQASLAVHDKTQSRVVTEILLLYLTGVVFFVNRHGLLKKLGSPRAAKTQSAVEPRFKC